MKTTFLNEKKIYVVSSRNELIDYALLHKKILVAINAEKILNKSHKAQKIINENIGYPDGIGAVMALRKKGFNNSIKIPGCELWLDIVKREFKSKSFYFIGSTKDVIRKTIIKLKNEFEGINILNYRDGYINNNYEHQLLINDVVRLSPDIVFVALGSPKQEILMQELSNSHSATYQGLGGSFDVYVEKVLRAPNWWVKNNLEWAFRLIKQPTRIKRQFILIRFYILLHLNKL